MRAETQGGPLSRCCPHSQADISDVASVMNSAHTDTSPFASTLSLAVGASSPSLAQLVRLADALLAARVNAAVKEELVTLGGALRDEYKVLINGIKADWNARIVAEVEEDEDAHMIPTITSDFDGTREMSQRVDAMVERDYEARLAEAESRFKESARRREMLQVELFLGEQVRVVYGEDEEMTDGRVADARGIEELALVLREALSEALDLMGVNAAGV